MTERQQELERRLQDVTGQLGSNKKGTKKGKLSSDVLNIHELNGGLRFQKSLDPIHNKLELNRSCCNVSFSLFR